MPQACPYSLAGMAQMASSDNSSLLQHDFMDAAELQVEVYSDVSGSWGCVASWAAQWFQLSWKEVAGAKEWGIMTKVMLPIVVTAAVLGSQWKGLTIMAPWHSAFRVV